MFARLDLASMYENGASSQISEFIRWSVFAARGESPILGWQVRICASTDHAPAVGYFKFMQPVAWAMGPCYFSVRSSTIEGIEQIALDFFDVPPAAAVPSDWPLPVSNGLRGSRLWCYQSRLWLRKCTAECWVGRMKQRDNWLDRWVLLQHLDTGD